jgi:hypothetical protein
LFFIFAAGKVEYSRQHLPADLTKFSTAERKPMASKYWIKLYHEILDDPKMGRLPDALFRRVIEFFLMAGDFGRDGGLPDLEDMAWRLRADETELKAQMEDLEALNILSRDAGGTWRVAHFKERQAPSPAIERMRRSRDSGKNDRLRKINVCYEDDAKRNTDTEADGDIDTEAVAEEDGRSLREQAPDIPEPLRRPGARAKETIDPDAEGDIEEESTAGSIRGDGLVKLFIELTGLPLFMGGEDKWARALERMKCAGVGEADLELAIDECRQKGLTIASLGSVVNPAIIAMSRSRAGRPEEDYRRYLKGEYGEVGRVGKEEMDNKKNSGRI